MLHPIPSLSWDAHVDVPSLGLQAGDELTHYFLGRSIVCPSYVAMLAADIPEIGGSAGTSSCIEPWTVSMCAAVPGR
jgi:hypothetical protein